MASLSTRDCFPELYDQVSINRRTCTLLPMRVLVLGMMRTGTKWTPFTRADWDQLLGHCASVTDLPCTCFAEELIAANPDAKVILTHCGIDAWHSSCMTTIILALRSPFIRIFAYLNTGYLRLWYPMLQKTFLGLFGGMAGFEANAKEIYRQHYDKVTAIMPMECLLEFQVDEGWQRLCAF
ncbi:MAG: hypothetical protein FRX48_00662 [Lasallia pustulata]|uniref:Uncharacterized protein n=1 Tax=Lasallia pustulata TaxID=136370 RepID=A0A5M8Q427_9LECA|nr:MAG: hypothetical protein FRX48_00662 [Lasallia pustulata]